MKRGEGMRSEDEILGMLLVVSGCLPLRLNSKGNLQWTRSGASPPKRQSLTLATYLSRTLACHREKVFGRLLESHP